MTISLSGINQTKSLDRHNLLQAALNTPPIKPTHRDWFLHQAILLSQMKNTDPATQQQLKLAILHAYSKISTMSESQSEAAGFQTSPFLPASCRYHRNTTNELISDVDEAYARDLGFQPYELRLIDNPLIAEVFARELPHPDLNLNMRSFADIEELLDRLLADAKNDKFPEERLLIDITQLIDAFHVDAGDVRRVVRLIEDLLVVKLNALPFDLDKNKLAQSLLAKLHLIAFVTHKDQPLLLFPLFFLDPHERFGQKINQLFNNSALRNRHGEFDRWLNRVMARTGYRVCPIQAKAAWLKIDGINTIFKQAAIPVAALTKPISSPQVCKDAEEFMAQPVVAKFRDLSKKEKAPPYLKILPKATFKLLKGLMDGSIDSVYKNKGIESLLQISYFRLLNAMNEVIYKQNDFIAFYNQIELIHQEIQDILIILQPHAPDVLAKSIASRLSSIIPLNLPHPEVYLKTSAMHGFSSILSSVEAQKGTHALNVAVSKNSYYFQSDETLKQTKTYQLSVLGEGELNSSIDVFVTEFHHNIQVSTQCYQPEDVLGQIKALYENKKFAKQFTVVIDTTIGPHKSKDLQALLADSWIQELITKGELNVVLLRSAQKFDMLGFDNYYGGLITTMHDSHSFIQFDQRMRKAEDQLKGISYQGLAHLQKYAGDMIDQFCEAIIKSTQMLYKKLPKAAIYQEGSTNPMQISQLKDSRLFFLDVKFPKYPKTSKAFQKCFFKFAQKAHLPFAVRPSFGFANTTVSLIDGEKFRLNVGLEGQKVLNVYASFFNRMQQEIEQIEVTDGITLEEHDQLIAGHLIKCDFK